MKEPCKNCNNLDEQSQLEIANPKDPDNRSLTPQARITIEVDSAEQKELLEQLKTSHERFQQLTEATFEGIAIHRGQTILEANQQFADIFGYTIDELKGMDCLKLAAPMNLEQVKQYANKKEPDLSNSDLIELVGVRKDGSPISLEVRRRQITWEGQPANVAAVRDMTEQKNLLKQLQKSEELYRTVVENAQEVIIIVDADGNYLFMNDFTLKQHRTTLEEIVGKNITEELPEEFASEKIAQIKSILEKNEPLKTINLVPLPTGPRWHKAIRVPLKDISGKPNSVLIMARDIHDEKLALQQLEESRQKYKQLYDNAHVALFRMTLDGKLLYCNKACLAFFGHSPNEPETNYINKVRITDYYVNPARRQAFIDTLMEKKRVNNFEIELKKTDGTTFWTSFSAEVFPEKGYIEGALYDITLEKVLTGAEQNVLTLLMEGKSNKEIAKELRRSVRTIEDHRSHIMHKLGVDNPFDLAKKVMERNNNHLKL